MYLVDTNVVSEARRGAAEAVGWLRSVDPLAVHLSVITLGEIMRGVALKQKSDPQTASRLAQWLQTLRRDHGDRILPVTDAIAVEWGRIAARRRRRPDRRHRDRPRPHRRHPQRRRLRRHPRLRAQPVGPTISTAS